MNLKDLRDYVRAQAEVDTDDVTDTQLNTIINQSYDMICSVQDWPFLEANSDLAVGGGGTATMPSDFGALRSQQRYTDGSTFWILRERNPEEIDRYIRSSVASGPPRFFYIEGTTLSLYPNPGSGTVKLRYYKRQKPLADTADATNDNTPIFDRRFHTLPARGALVEVYKRLDMWQESRLAKQDFEEGLAGMDIFYLRARQPVTYGEKQREELEFLSDAPFPFELR